MSTTSDSNRVGEDVFSPHFKRQFSNAERFFKLQPSKEYFSLSRPVILSEKSNPTLSNLTHCVSSGEGHIGGVDRGLSEETKQYW